MPRPLPAGGALPNYHFWFEWLDLQKRFSPELVNLFNKVTTPHPPETTPPDPPPPHPSGVCDAACVAGLPARGCAAPLAGRTARSLSATDTPPHGGKVSATPTVPRPPPCHALQCHSYPHIVLNFQSAIIIFVDLPGRLFT